MNLGPTWVHLGPKSAQPRLWSRVATPTSIHIELQSGAGTRMTEQRLDRVDRYTRRLHGL